MSKQKYLILDTETAGTLDNPLIYDLGAVVIDNTGKIYATFNAIISEIFYNHALMCGSYYTDKISYYVKKIANKEIEVLTYKTAYQQIIYLLQTYKIKKIICHNTKFDYKAILNTADILDYKPEITIDNCVSQWLCTLKMARKIMLNNSRYTSFCDMHGYKTATGRNKLTAEILARYITKDNNYIEKHTALQDAIDTIPIFLYLNNRVKNNDKIYLK